MADVMRKDSLPRLVIPPHPSPGLQDSLIHSGVVSPLESQQQQPLWPSLGAVLSAELATRLAHGEGEGSEAAAGSEEDQRLEVAAHVGQILLERNHKQEAEIQQLQALIEETLEQNKHLHQDLVSLRQGQHTLEVERDYYESALGEVEGQRDALGRARAGCDSREADLMAQMKELQYRYDEQEQDLASLTRRSDGGRRCSRCTSHEDDTTDGGASTPTAESGSSRCLVTDDGKVEEDPWAVVSELQSRLQELSESSKKRESTLQQELAQVDAEKTALQDKLTATQLAVRKAFQRRGQPSSDSDAVDGAGQLDDSEDDDDGDDDALMNKCLASPVMLSLQPSTRHRTLERCMSAVPHRTPQASVSRKVFPSSSTPIGSTSDSSAGVSLWSEVSDENKDLQARYDKLLRSFHSDDASSDKADGDGAPLPPVSSSYTGMFEELFGMLHRLKTRLVTDLRSPPADATLDMSTEILMPM